jgi:hypothetical protein
LEKFIPVKKINLREHLRSKEIKEGFLGGKKSYAFNNSRIRGSLFTEK